MTCNRCICFVISLAVLSPVTSDNCVYEVCQCEEMFIFCSARGLTAIPPLTGLGNGVAVNLVFDNNNISTIPADSLPAGMVQMTFQYNSKTSIDDHAFEPSGSTLTSLLFAQSRFTKIPDALTYIKALKNLEIDETNIEDWNVGVMRYVGRTLQTLSLKNVTMTTWPGWLSQFASLTELTLVYCKLTSIPDDALDTMAHGLVILTLTGNLLTSVPKALSKLTALQTLQVDLNAISETTWLPSASKLLILWLDNNRIYNASQLSQSLRPFASSITELDIINNKLKSIPDLDFLTSALVDLSNNRIYDTQSGSVQPRINRLVLSYNFLPTVPRIVSGLKVMTDLVLANNLIREVHASEIPRTVTYLDLSYNQITALTDTSFGANSSLMNLHLGYNPITAISSSALTGLRLLVYLYLGNTGLTRLPRWLSSMSTIGMLDVSDNQGLVCTCQEQSLQGWIGALGRFGVTGTCGEMSVYDFFSILSPQCPKH